MKLGSHDNAAAVAELLDEEASVMDIELEDVGEVLLSKIARLKQELRGCEEQLKEVSSPASEARFNLNLPSRNQNADNGRGIPDNNDNRNFDKTEPGADQQPYDSRSNGLDAYELLEEKHRLSYGTSPTIDGTTIAEPIPKQREKVEDTSLKSDFGRRDSPAMTRERRETFKVRAAPRLNDDGTVTTVTSCSTKSSDEAPVQTDMYGIIAPSMQRGQHVRGNSLPGAVSIHGIGLRAGASSALPLSSGHTTVTRGETIDEETTLSYQQSANSNENEETGMLVEANLVDESHATNSGPLVSAKRDPWYRRNQWWLAGALVLIVASIVLAIVLTSVDLSPAPAPTISPTTELNGVETRTEALVLASFPAAATSLADTSSSQSKALRWVIEQRFNDAPSQINSSIRTLQQYALASLYFSTIGELTWTENYGWLNNTNECDWYGVECEQEGDDGELVVIHLSLPSNNMSGRIPSDLAILSTGLVTLDLSVNQLTASIPSELNALLTLATLDLSSNRLGSSIPTSFQALTKLENLDLSFNVLTGSIPSGIESLKLLRSLNVRQNDLIGAIPTQIGRLERLEYFNCESNRLAFAVPTEIGHLEMLKSFHGGNNVFVGALPSEIGSLEGLVSFHLSNNTVAGGIPYHIMLLSNLKSLDLSSNTLTGVVPTNVGMLRSLTSLTLSGNRLDNLLPRSIDTLQRLTHLDVSRNSFQEDVESYTVTSTGKQSDDVPWIELAQLTNLVYLNLGGMPFRFYADELLQLTNLEVLGLAGMNLGSHLSPNDLFRSLAVLTALREVDFSNNYLYGREIPTEVAQLTNLEALDFHGNRLIGRIPTEISALSHLRILNFEQNNFSGTIPSEIWKLNNLTDLILAGRTNHVKSSLSGSIPSNIGQLTKLRRLDLGWSEITGVIPSEIGLTKLEELRLPRTAIRGSIPSHILLLTNLRSFSLRATDVSGTIPELDEKFDKLEKLDLSSTQLSGSIPPGLWSSSLLSLLEIDSTNHIYGSIPSGIIRISNLVTLKLAGVNMTGSKLPSEIGLMKKLRMLDLSNARLSGTIPPEIFKCPQLSNLRIGGNFYSGSLPSELGLASNLLSLQVSNVPISGLIPTEIGALRLLESLDLSNTEIEGWIPSEMSGRLLLLSTLNLASTHISGPIPSNISNLLSLRSLSLSNTDITGGIPSAIAMMTELTFLNISQTDIAGTLPIEMTTMESIYTMDFRGSNITGFIPDFFCEWFEEHSKRAVISGKRTAHIDCGSDLVYCNCCDCDITIVVEPGTLIFVTMSPIAAPVYMPSTSTSPT